MTSTSLRLHLRDHTRQAHEELDRTIGRLDSARAYQSFLRASYAHRQPVEHYLAGADWPASFGTWRPTALAPLITADLADIGSRPPDIRPFHLSKDIASLVGVIYVLEGSALGAKLIRRMAGALGYDENHGARHLVRQERLGSWRDLLAIMERLESIDMAMAVCAAETTFEQAATAMRENGFGR